MSQSHIVLDKSYLQGVSGQRIHSLALSGKLLLCESLMIETAKTEPEERASLFKKLPMQPRHCEYIPSIQRLMQYERERGKAAGKPSSHIELRDYSITEKLKDPSFQLPAVPAAALRSSMNFFEELLQGAFKEVKDLFERLDKKAAETEYKELLDGGINDPKLISLLIKKGRDQGARLPVTPSFDENWLTYRWFQVRHIHAVSWRSRYDAFHILEAGKARVQALHDIHDMSYLMLALLEGRFAVREHKLQDWMRAIRGPESVIAE